MDMITGDGDGDLFDASPYLKLYIDKEGRWFQNGAEIIHPAIYRQFNEMLEMAPGGGYRVRLGREICTVEVEDAPFVVKRVIEAPSDELALELNDGTREPLDPEAVWIGDRNVPYATVKKGAFHARFSRPAYYQLATFIDSDESQSNFFLVLNGKRTPLKVERKSTPASGLES